MAHRSLAGNAKRSFARLLPQHPVAFDELVQHPHLRKFLLEAHHLLGQLINLALKFGILDLRLFVELLLMRESFLGHGDGRILLQQVG